MPGYDLQDSLGVTAQIPGGQSVSTLPFLLLRQGLILEKNGNAVLDGIGTPARGAIQAGSSVWQGKLTLAHRTGKNSLQGFPQAS
jgi:hypothetical protein